MKNYLYHLWMTICMIVSYGGWSQRRMMMIVVMIAMVLKGMPQ